MLEYPSTEERKTTEVTEKPLSTQFCPHLYVNEVAFQRS